MKRVDSYQKSEREIAREGIVCGERVVGGGRDEYGEAHRLAVVKDSCPEFLTRTQTW